METDWGSGKSLPQFAPTVGADPEFIRWWGKFERLGGTPGTVTALMRMNSQIDITGVLPGIRVPTLVIHRSEDVLVDVAGGRELAARIPHAELVELPGPDHLFFVGNGDLVLDSIERFLSRTQAQERSDRVIATIVLVRPDGEAGAVRGPLDEVLRRFRATRVAACARGLAASFDGPARALECAVAAARALHQRSLGHRIGMHTGEIGLAPAPLEGLALDIAADVAGHAAGGEILASRTVRDLVAGCGIALHDCGDYRLPAIGECWHLFRVES